MFRTEVHAKSQLHAGGHVQSPMDVFVTSPNRLGRMEGPRTTLLSTNTMVAVLCETACTAWYCAWKFALSLWNTAANIHASLRRRCASPPSSSTTGLATSRHDAFQCCIHKRLAVSAKAGVADEEAPRCVFPAVVGKPKHAAMMPGWECLKCTDSKQCRKISE